MTEDLTALKLAASEAGLTALRKWAVDQGEDDPGVPDDPEVISFLAAMADGMFTVFIDQLSASQSEVERLTDERDRLLDHGVTMEAALRPFAELANQLEEQGPRGTWIGLSDDIEDGGDVVSMEVHKWKAKDASPRELKDDTNLITVGVEYFGGGSYWTITMGMLRAARALLPEVK